MRKLTAVLLSLSLSTAPVVGQPNMPPDNTGGAKLHMAGSAAIGAGLNLALPDRPWTAFGLCSLVGVLKEAADYRKGQPGYKHGLFSRNDIRADMVGCGIGWMTALGLRWVFTRHGVTVSKEF